MICYINFFFNKYKYLKVHMTQFFFGTVEKYVVWNTQFRSLRCLGLKRKILWALEVGPFWCYKWSGDWSEFIMDVTSRWCQTRDSCWHWGVSDEKRDVEWLRIQLYLGIKRFRSRRKESRRSRRIECSNCIECLWHQRDVTDKVTWYFDSAIRIPFFGTKWLNFKRS